MRGVGMPNLASLRTTIAVTLTGQQCRVADLDVTFGPSSAPEGTLLLRRLVVDDFELEALGQAAAEAGEGRAHVTPGRSADPNGD